MTRVIHTGDTHIGYQQYHSPERRQDFLDAFRQVAEDAVAAEVDAVVHAGDLFHDRRPGLQDILGTLSVLRTLDDAGIPVLAVVGNHESKRDGQWLDLFESLGLAARLGAEPTVVGDVAFYGLDYVPRSQRDTLDYAFTPSDAAAAALVTHGLFQPFDHGDWDAAEVLRGSNVEFDAMLLGDNHTPGQAEVADAWVTYCGSTERASASEREDRGYNLVEFDEGVRITRRGLSTRPFRFVDVELAPGEGVERVTEQVSQYDLADAVCIVTVEGEGERIAPADVESFVRSRGALVARVNDRREFEAAREVEVSFSDPDEAVRERVRELGLSGAARSIDETVRESTVADSNVAEEVEARTRELLEDAGSFSRATGEGSENEDEGGVESESAASADGGTGEGGDGGPSPGESEAGESEAGESEAGAEESEGSADGASMPTADGEDAGSDGQSTWGDYA